MHDSTHLHHVRRVLMEAEGQEYGAVAGGKQLQDRAQLLLGLVRRGQAVAAAATSDQHLYWAQEST